MANDNIFRFIEWQKDRKLPLFKNKKKKTGFIQFSDFCSAKLHKNLQVK